MHRFFRLILAALLVVSAGCTGYLSDRHAAAEQSDEKVDPAGDQGVQGDQDDREEPPARPGDEFSCTTEVRDPGPALIRRLTVPEYVETVRSSLGVDIGEEARRLLPEDVSADGFSNTAYNLNVDLAHIKAYTELADLVTAKMDLSAYVAQHASCTDLTEACLREVITQMGKWVLRGPLIDQEIDAFLTLTTSVIDEGGDFEEAMDYVLQAMLQSPRFLYRVENQTGDGSVRSVDAYELASRLSYFLWGGPPDHELMAAADADRLSEPADIQAQVERMLADPRARKTSQRFVHDWLSLGRLASLAPNEQHFPTWSDALAEDMRAETLQFFEHVVWEQNRPLQDIFSAQFTFATPRLAEHYGLEPKEDALVKYDLSDVPERGGILTQGSVLTIGGDEASMVARGLFVLSEVLCSGVDDPPPGVDTTPVPPEPGKPQRAVAEDRLANPSCGGCHRHFEPLAFGLGKFDGTGAYHETDEHDNQLRDDGELLFPGQREPIAYDNSAEMMQLLTDSERVQQCMTLKASQFAIGRPLLESDSCILNDIRERAIQGGGTYASLIAAIATSDLVHLTRTER